MKKLSILLFVIGVSILLVGCDSLKKEEPIDFDTLKVGMDLRWPPFETKDDSGNPSGISVSLAYELGDYLGIPIEIVDTDFSTIIPALESGAIDIIIGSMSITEEREQSINFSNPYFYFPLITLLDNDVTYNGRHIETKEELWSIPTLNFVGQRTFVSLSIPLEYANNPNILEFDDAASAVLSLVNGDGDAWIISPVSAVENQMNYQDNTYILWDPVMYSPIGMGLRQYDQRDLDLLDRVNEFIAGMEENGVYGRLNDEFKEIINASLPGQDIYFYVGNDEEE